MNKFRSEQSGRSMVEMLGVLAIIGVLSVGGIAGYSKAMAKFKLSKAMDQVSTTVTNIRTMYSGQPDYTGLANDTAISLGLVGAEMVSGSAIKNAFSGAVTIKAEDVNSMKDAGFSVKFEGLGKEACISLASADWGSGSGSGLVSITPTKGTAVGISALPMSISDAATGCEADGDGNSVTWVYF